MWTDSGGRMFGSFTVAQQYVYIHMVGHSASQKGNHTVLVLV